MNKKAIVVKIMEFLVSYVPLAVYVGYNLDKFYQTGERITMSVLIFLSIIALLAFKDLKQAIIKYYKKPSSFGFSFAVLIMSIIAIIFGRTFFELSLVSTISLGVGIIFATWYNKLTNKKTENRIIEALNNLLEKE